MTLACVWKGRGAREITVKFRYRSIDFHVDSVPLEEQSRRSEGSEESNKQKTNLLLGSRLISLWANEPKRNPYINPGFSSLALTIINRIILQGAAGVFLPSRFRVPRLAAIRQTSYASTYEPDPSFVAKSRAFA